MNKKSTIVWKRGICIALACMLWFFSVDIWGLSTEAYAAQPDEKSVLTELDAQIPLNTEAKPQGGMLTTPSLSDEEIAACETDYDSFEELTTSEELILAEEDFDLALEAYYREHEDQLAICDEIAREAEAISENDCTQLAVDQVGYATLDAAAEYVRAQMVNRKTTITVKFAKGPDSSQRDFQKMMELAIGYFDGCKPVEADYIRWNWMRYQWASQNAGQAVTYRILIQWRSDGAQEIWVNQKISEIIAALDLRNPAKSDYQKVTQIYDYIMDTVTYDHYHFDNPLFQQTYMPMYTAYTALKDGSGVCQAYALIFYRLCMEIGIPARIIAGNDNEQGVATHGWNIVRLGDYYYNVDATWDDETAGKRTYYLKNMTDFQGHVRHKVDYENPTFMARFPMAETSYVEPKEYLAVPNIEVLMSNNKAGIASTKAEGKFKVLYFLKSDEPNSDKTLVAMKNWTMWNQNDCDVILYDMTPADTYLKLNLQKGISEDVFIEKLLNAFNNATNLSYVKQSDATRALRNQYAALLGGAQGTGCCGVLIDPNNQIRWFANGVLNAGELDAAYRQLKTGAGMLNMGTINASQTKNNQVMISWNYYPGATRYHVFRKGSNASEYSCVGTTTNNMYYNEVLSPAGYDYIVYASDGVNFIAQSVPTSVICNTIYLSKGATGIVEGDTYKVLSSGAGNRTVSFIKASDAKKIIVPDEITLDGLKYKVVEIGANAFKNKKELVTVSIGKNVKKIEKNAFVGCKKLVQIVVEGKNLKSIGKNAFKKTGTKAVVFVPGSKYAKYKKLFQNKGLSPKASIKK